MLGHVVELTHLLPYLLPFCRALPSSQALNEMAIVPERKTDAPMRVPISGAYKIKGVGDVLAGRVEQGVVKPGDEVIFLPTHTTANPCIGKVRHRGLCMLCCAGC